MSFCSKCGTQVADDVAFFAEKEGLSAHARSATVRFEDVK